MLSLRNDDVDEDEGSWLVISLVRLCLSIVSAHLSQVLFLLIIVCGEASEENGEDVEKEEAVGGGATNGV